MATKKAVKTKAATKKAAASSAKTKAKTATKKTAAKKKATPAKKKTATKKTATAKRATKKTTAKAAPAKAATKKAVKKAAKPAATKKAAVKKAPATDVAETVEAEIKPINVGQAPRKTTLAASIPVPSQMTSRDAPQADAEAPQNVEAATNAKQDFKVDDKIVYPAHGVGRIVGLEKQQVAGVAVELFVIDFDQEKMKLRVPTGKAKAAGMRGLSSTELIKKAVETLKGRARIKRTMWSRRAQEYDAKINSGDIMQVAEVVRDLYRAGDQPEQSYSERQLFEAALDRMAREVAAVHEEGLEQAIERLQGSLHQKKAA